MNLYKAASGDVVVTLSERNLITLMSLWQGHQPDNVPMLHRTTDQGRVSVVIENNDKHYQGRQPGEGVDIFTVDREAGEDA